VFFDSSKDSRGGHEWLIEFQKPPADVAEFARLLDSNLQKINSDYEAKRYKDMALAPLKLSVLPNDTFMNWMKERGKFGNQNKVPRLANHRAYIESVLGMLGSL
jgi:hypothetical protein